MIIEKCYFLHITYSFVFPKFLFASQTDRATLHLWNAKDPSCLRLSDLILALNALFLTKRHAEAPTYPVM